MDAQGSGGKLLPHSAGLKMRQGEKEGVAEREGLVDVDGETVVDVVGHRPDSASLSDTTAALDPDFVTLVGWVLPSEQANGPMLRSPEQTPC